MTSRPEPRDPFRIAAEALAGGPTRWQNLGLWHGTCDYSLACEALAIAVGDAAQLGPSDCVVELACGAGAAFPLWTGRFGAAEVVGIELDAIRAARAAELGPVVVGPAIANGRLGGPDTVDPIRAIDAVICVDAAYHIGSAKSLASATHSALRDGGRLAFTTLTCNEDANTASSFPWAWFARRAGISEGAIQSHSTWLQILSDAGFADIAIVPLDAVLRGFVAHVGRRRPAAWRTRGWAKIEATALLARLGLWSGQLGYTLISAIRARAFAPSGDENPYQHHLSSPSAVS